MMNLKSLGLNSFETRAYEALVKLGTVPASKVASVSRVPYGRIYDTLESLILKGLVTITEEKPRMYSATSPDVIKELIESRMNELQELNTEVTKLKQIYEAKPKEKVIMVRGKVNFNKIVKNLDRPKTFSYNLKWSSDFNPIWAKNVKADLKKGIENKQLSRYDDETKENVQKWLTINKNIRKIPNDGVAMSITDTEVMLALIHSDITMVIRDRSFVEIMKHFFRAYYEKAEEIKSE